MAWVMEGNLIGLGKLITGANNSIDSQHNINSNNITSSTLTLT